MTKVMFNIGQDTIYGVVGVDTLVTAKAATRRTSGDTLVTRNLLRESDSKPFTLDLAPTSLGQAWVITVAPDNGDSFTGYYKVPAGDTVNFLDLIEVDPDTLEPTDDPDPEWWAVARSTVNGGKVVNDHLILTRNDGVEIDAGNVRGLPGQDGVDGVDGAPGRDGVNGAPGRDGVSVVSSEINADGDLLVTLSDDQVVNAGRARGFDGKDASEIFASATDYGVTGDGITDDTAALQTLIDNVASSGGGVVWLPKTVNSYKISDTIFIPANIRVMGENKKTLIWGNFDKPFIAGKLDGATRIDNIEVSSLEIVRQGTAKTTPIIDWTGISHSEMKNVMIRQAVEPATSTGLLLGEFSYYNRFEGVQIRGCELGVRLVDAANGNIFAGGVSILFGVRGYHISNSNSNYFTGSSAEQLTGYAVLVDDGSKQNVFAGCRIEFVAEFAFKIAFSANPAFSNYFFGNALYLGEGVERYVSQTDNVVIDYVKGYVLSTLEHSLQRNFCSYSKNTAQHVPAGGAITPLTFPSKSIDRKSEFDGTTFTAKTAGVYTVSSAVKVLQATNGEEIGLYVRKNGGVETSIGKGIVIGSSAIAQGSRKVELTTGDTLTFFVKSDSASYSVTSGMNFSWLQIMRDA